MDSIALYDDKEFFLLIAEGNKEAFTQFFKKYTSQLTPFVLRLTKSDCITNEVIQEIFMRIWFNREKLTGITDPRNWVYRIAASVCYTFLKELLVENKIVNIIQHESYYGNNGIFETVRLYKLAADIQAAIKHLTPEQKKVYRLKRVKGLKVPEIADELSLSPNSVRNLLNSSVESVHDYLQNKKHSI